ncbi:MAG: Lpg1974 family pore-forming outer membrane protein [Planctomycetaceae bacterium]|nr:Lpg1974 family pore-forming outer membrane protein [Planctomycetaceae bacterium]
MHAKPFVLAAILAALAGAGNTALAQYGPSPYGYPPSYGPMMGPGMMGPATMPGMYGPAGVASAGYMGGGPVQGPGPSCDAGYSKGGCADDCCGGGYTHCWSVFGEFLYMRPRDAEVAYAVPIDGNITDPSDPVFQVGEVQVVDPDFQPGFRAGFTRTCSECALVAVTYAQLDADANDTLVLPGGSNFLARSLVSPLPINAAVDGLDAEAHLFVQFKTLDVDFKNLISYCDDYRVAFVVGARFAKLNQEFDALFTVQGFETVETDVEFEGAGIKLGLEAERFARCSKCFVYGKGDVSFLGGESRATYFGTNQADAAIVDTSWEAGRVVTITSVEAGLGWQNHCGNLRLSAGYSFSTWYNITRTNEWINAVQKNNFADESDNLFGFMSFDGINARIEVLW